MYCFLTAGSPWLRELDVHACHNGHREFNTQTAAVAIETPEITLVYAWFQHPNYYHVASLHGAWEELHELYGLKGSLCH